MPDLPGSSPEQDEAMIDDVLDGTERVRCLLLKCRLLGSSLAGLRQHQLGFLFLSAQVSLWRLPISQSCRIGAKPCVCGPLSLGRALYAT